MSQNPVEHPAEHQKPATLPGLKIFFLAITGTDGGFSLSLSTM